MRQALPFTLHEMNIVPEITRQAAGEGDACLLFALEGRLIALVSHRRYVLHANDYILLGPEETARLATQGGARVLLLRMETGVPGRGRGGRRRPGWLPSPLRVWRKTGWLLPRTTPIC